MEADLLFNNSFSPPQEEARCVRQEPCASLTPTSWTTSYRGWARGEGLHFDRGQAASRWSPLCTRCVATACGGNDAAPC